MWVTHENKFEVNSRVWQPEAIHNLALWGIPKKADGRVAALHGVDSAAALHVRRTGHPPSHSCTIRTTSSTLSTRRCLIEFQITHTRTPSNCSDAMQTATHTGLHACLGLAVVWARRKTPYHMPVPLRKRMCVLRLVPWPLVLWHLVPWHWDNRT